MKERERVSLCVMGIKSERKRKKMRERGKRLCPAITISKGEGEERAGNNGVREGLRGESVCVREGKEYLCCVSVRDRKRVCVCECERESKREKGSK